MEVELTCLVICAVDQEGRESNLIAELVGSQECVLEERCTDAVSLCALIDGKPREEKNGTWLRAPTGFEGIWEFAAVLLLPSTGRRNQAFRVPAS